MTKAAVGDVVSIYYDGREVQTAEVLQTSTGRTYLIVSKRVQRRGAHVGRQHLRCLIVEAEEVKAKELKIHPLHWYKRGTTRVFSRR